MKYMCLVYADREEDLSAQVLSAFPTVVRDGETLLTDGPFAEIKEHLGGSYGMAETPAHRIRTQEEHVGATPGLALLPWFFAGSLYPISALPAGLAGVARVFPLTHALAVMRYGLIDRRGAGLHDIWGPGDPGVQALLSLAVVAAFAVALTVLSIRVVTRAAVR